MRRSIIDPIGVSTIDLLVCAFIALVVLNILQQADDRETQKPKQNLEIYFIETTLECPLEFCLQVGDKQWWPGSQHPDISYIVDRSQVTRVSHQLVTHFPASAGKISLLVFATPAPGQLDIAWKVRITKLSAGKAFSKTDNLDRGHFFRSIFPKK